MQCVFSILTARLQLDAIILSGILDLYLDFIIFTLKE